MRATIAFAIVAVVLALFGFAFLGVARLEGHMADAGQRLSTLQYESAQESLAGAEQYADHSRFVPFLGTDARQEIRARAGRCSGTGSVSTMSFCRQALNPLPRSTKRTSNCNSSSRTPSSV